jgi:hypothetical protein
MNAQIAFWLRQLRCKFLGLEDATIVRAQGASENEKFAAEST